MGTHYAQDEFSISMLHGGYNRQFREAVQRKRLVQFKRIGLPAPKIQCKAKVHRTESVRRQRSELASKAKLIDEQTRRLVPNDADKGRPAKAIIVDTARAHGVSYDDICGHSRAVYIVAVRRQAICRVFLAHHPKMSFTRIGWHFGGKDHTTVLHAVRKASVWRGAHGA